MLEVIETFSVRLSIESAKEAFYCENKCLKIVTSLYISNHKKQLKEAFQINITIEALTEKAPILKIHHPITNSLQEMRGKLGSNKKIPNVIKGRLKLSS